MEPIFDMSNEDDYDNDFYDNNINKLMGNLENNKNKISDNNISKNSSIEQNENTFVINSNKVLITNLDTKGKIKNEKLKSPIPKLKSKIEIPLKEKSNNKNYNLNAIDNFEKNLKNEDFEYNKLQDSDYEEDLINEDVDTLTDKNEIIKRYKMIKEKLNEKNFQINNLQKNLEEIKKSSNELMDIISKDGNSELKDKKLIELAKKNRDLNLKIEKLKLKEKEILNKLNLNENENNKISKHYKSDISNLIIPTIMTNSNEEEMKKKIKLSETKIVEMRNKLQNAKEENTKLNILIKREIGEAIDIDKALKDKVYWKGRAEVMESLKTKIKILESQLETLNINSNNIVNNNNSINNSILTKPNNNFVHYSEYKKEKENFKSEIEKLKEENLKYSNEHSKIKVRNQVLEKEIKSQKDNLTNKIKILIEKSDNDEKLILAMNKELEKKGRGVNPAMLGYENPIFNLNQEINKLRLEMKEKDEFINHVNTIMIPDGNNGNNWNMQTLSKLIGKLKDLEDENKQLKINSDDGKIYESLARDNAKLRLRIKDLEDRLNQD